MNKQEYRAALRRYMLGGVGALGWTLVAYGLVASRVVYDFSLLATYVLVAALLQLVVQLVCFVHLPSEATPKWRQMSFFFTVLMVVVIIIGSIWIMLNLNYNMGMSGQDMDKYMMHQNKIGF